MKKLFFCAAALLAAISFAACSDDDDEPNLPVTLENIAGTWQIVNETGWEIYDGEKEAWSENYPDEEGWYYTFTFNKDGSMIDTVYEDGVEKFTSDYSISGNTIHGDSFTYEIQKLTQSELVLLHTLSEPNYSFEEIMTFKRIK